MGVEPGKVIRVGLEVIGGLPVRERLEFVVGIEHDVRLGSRVIARVIVVELWAQQDRR
jgi:hypothetical protein